MVNGFIAPDYYVRSITYATDLAGLTEVIERAVSCEQRIKYQCKNSKLMEIYQSKYILLFLMSSWPSQPRIEILSLPLGLTKPVLALFYACLAITLDSIVDLIN